MEDIPEQIFEFVQRVGKLGLIERLASTDPSDIQFGVKNVDKILTIGNLSSLYLNAIGAFYPALPGSRKESISSEIRWLIESEGLFQLRDPRMFSDMLSHNPDSYRWFHDRVKSLGKENFRDIREWVDKDGLFYPDKVSSDFLFACTVLSSEGGEKYAKIARPGFLYRVLRGITNMSFTNIKYGGNFHERREELRQTFPPNVQERIDRFAESYKTYLERNPNYG